MLSTWLYGSSLPCCSFCCDIGNVFFFLISETSVFIFPSMYSLRDWLFCSHGTMILYNLLRIPGLCSLLRFKKWIVWFLRVRGSIKESSALCFLAFSLEYSCFFPWLPVWKIIPLGYTQCCISALAVLKTRKKILWFVAFSDFTGVNTPPCWF